jgi:hypothetical protein
MIKFIHSEDTENVLSRCHELLNEYHKTNDPLPAMLISTEKKLAGYYAFLIRRKAEYQAWQNAHYWIRKVAHSREAIKARATHSQGDSSHIATGNIEKQIEDETFSVWRYEDLNGFCRALDKVFITIAHQLKDYEKERTTSRHGT